MKNFLFFKAFYEGQAHYLCDFYEYVTDDGAPSVEISVEVEGKQILCHALQNTAGIWEIGNSNTDLNNAVKNKLLDIIQENRS
ncbi:hypothetical protein ACTHGU_15145 [Chitinophagaceae bacterium MMS25-I14]